MDRSGWSRRFFRVGLIVALGGGLGYFLLRPGQDGLPPEVAADPLLIKGREIYLSRCLACHGPSGRGDGTLAKGLIPRPRNLASDPWKYGDQTEQVLKVIAEGVKQAQMPGWGGTYGVEDLKATAAYLYHVSGKAVPASLRSSPRP